MVIIIEVFSSLCFSIFSLLLLWDQINAIRYDLSYVEYLKQYRVNTLEVEQVCACELELLLRLLGQRDGRASLPSVGFSSGRAIHECDHWQAEPRVFLLRQKPRVPGSGGRDKSGGEEEPVEIPQF